MSHPELTQHRLDRSGDWTMLGISSAALLLSFVLEVAPEGSGIRMGGFSVQGLPCLSKVVSGGDCPGCGLTRSFVCLAHGRMEESWMFHRVGLLMFAAMLFQFPYRAARLWRRRPDPPALRRALAFGQWGLIASLVGNWAFNLASGVPPLP